MDRLWLYANRSAIERIIQSSHDTPAEACSLYESLQPFLPLEEMQLSISDEVRLQRALTNKRKTLEEQLNHSLPQQRQLASRLRSFEAFSHHFATAKASRQEISRCTQELKEFFSAKHYVPDTLAAMDRVLEIVHTIPLHSKHEPALAAGALRYAASGAEALKRKLHNHLLYAHTQLETDLQRSGTHWLEAGELSRMYKIDCAVLEQQLDAVIDACKTRTLEAKELIIAVRCDKRCDDLAAMLQKHGEVRRFKLIPYLSLVTDAASASQMLAKPSMLGKKLTIYEPRIYTVKPQVAPFAGEDWNLDLVNAPAAWQYSKGEGTKVAIIDTGIDYRHPDLAERFEGEKGVDFINESDPLDDNGHGTHVAGTVAGIKTGVAPAAQLYAVKVLDMYGSGSEVSVLQGMEWAIEKGVDAANMSLGSAYPSDAEAELLAIAAERGVSFACAAGNDGDDSYSYPASHEHAISVAAVDSGKQHAYFSNYNDKVDLAAPGVSVYSTWLGGDYKSLSGTSMATPHVTGGCALLGLRPDKSAEDLLKGSAESLGDRAYFGAGLINLAEAVRK